MVATSTIDLSTRNPYDELAYKCLPIEWTAPERMALASLLHGGPRTPTDRFRVLELGCGNGANLVPLAHYRRASSFVGLDGAASQITIAKAHGDALGLANLEFVHADLREAERMLEGKFDYIIAHGVFSWVPDEARDAMLHLCSQRLSEGGLFYVNYNTYPGWSIRGLVRDFLIAQTAEGKDLLERARQCQEVATRMANSFDIPAAFESQRPYSHLIANEFEFVCDHDASYIAHEYLSPCNRAYWRSEFLDLTSAYGLDYVADADFNYASGRLPMDLPTRLHDMHLTGRCVEDTVDLLCYRQLHSPLLTRGPWGRQNPSTAEFGALYVASCLSPCSPEDQAATTFDHPPTGFQVETQPGPLRSALHQLHALWPAGRRVAELFVDVPGATEDLEFLHRNGLIELRLVETIGRGHGGDSPAPLIDPIERHAVTPHHTRVAITARGIDHVGH